MTQLRAGYVLHWNGYFQPGKGKFLLVLGRSPANEYLAFTLTTQQHWLSHAIHATAMVEIPQGATTFLKDKCWVRCFFEVERVSCVEYEQALLEGEVCVVGKLRGQYLGKVRDACGDLLSEHELEEIVTILNAALETSSSEAALT